MTKPTNEDLARWTAEKILGGKWADEMWRGDGYWFKGWDLPDGTELDVDGWNPCQSHDQAQMVFNALDDKQLEEVAQVMPEVLGSCRCIEYFKATPRAKMEAVWEALKDV